MSGGLHAKRGFNYQDTVILDLLMTHFQEHGPSSTIRPEGIDDLDLAWEDCKGSVQKRFVQVKKPREDITTNPTDAPWTLAQVTTELLPGTMTRLKGNTWEQLWVLGDNLSPDVHRLVDAGMQAPTQLRTVYWLTVHRLARSQVLARATLDATSRSRLVTWNPSSQLSSSTDEPISLLVEQFSQIFETPSSEEMSDDYRRALNEIHTVLPNVLSRLRIKPVFGSEDEVRGRIQENLYQQYGLDQSIINDTLYRNLRGFISDISIIPGRRFNAEEFEAELRTIWPTMTPIRLPPPLDERYLRRPDLSSIFASRWKGRALEAIGISGAGKTMLAAEVYEKSREENPDRPVFYIEVRSDTELRDVLVGVSFHLRRYAFHTPFRIASAHAAGNTPHQVALNELARGLAGVPAVFLLLIDLVDGKCSDAFCRDLRTFLNGCPATLCRLAVLGQESAFRHFTDLDRRQLAIESVDIRGFKFDEFRTLAAQRHERPDPSILQQVYDSVTAGRSAGLYGRLARSLADAPSLERMYELSQSPPGQLLQLAERDRFSRISASARGAAECLICFALPFSRAEAEDVFEEQNIGQAIRELLDLGLLRHTGTDAFEIHETVRAGLEDSIARSTKRQAHAALAAHYEHAGSISTAIVHIEEAGDEVRAQCCARASFLEGNHWASLSGYVIAKSLVTAREAIEVFSSSRAIDGGYLFPNIVAAVGEPADAETLIDIIRAQCARFGSDYNWSRAIAEAVLCLAPNLATELYRIALFAVEGRERTTAISAILLATRHNGTCDPQMVVAIFDSLSDEQKRAFAPVLFESGCRDTLKRAFQLAELYTPGSDEHKEVMLGFSSLRLSELTEVTEFLAAVPEVQDGRMFAVQSPLMGALASYIWQNRDCFNRHCVTLLRARTTELAVQKAAIRTLVLTGNSTLYDICDDLSARTEDPIHGFAALAPSLTPAGIELDRYEERLLDPASGQGTRVAALAVLASSGADLDVLYHRVLEVEGTNGSGAVWDFLFLQMASKRPFAAALPLLRTQLRLSSESSSAIWAAPLKALGTLPGLEATTMLLEGLAHSNRSIKQVAALSLQERRARSALEDLRQNIAAEQQKEFRVGVAAAIAASGASGAHDIDTPVAGEQDVMLWQCIVAARTRDATFASKLVEIANNGSFNWQLRRTAINAAGYLPFDVALEGMLEILQEQSAIFGDKSTNLYAHSFLSWLLLDRAQDLLGLFVDGRDQFVSVVSEMFVEGASGSLDAPDMGLGEEVGEWAYCRLRAAGWPDALEAPDIVINELNRPMLYCAVLRSLRRVGRMDLIETALSGVKGPWFAIKCILECLRDGYHGPEDASKLRYLISQSAAADNRRVDACIDEVVAARRTPQRAAATLSTPDALCFRQLSFVEAVCLLSGDGNATPLSAETPVLLDQLDREQLRKLVHLADPVNDAEIGEETYLPGVSFHGEGYTVASRRVSYSGGQETSGSLIRPAIVAANWFGVEIHWQESMFKGAFIRKKLERVLSCISVSANAEVLYELLHRYPEELLGPLGSHPLCEHIGPLIDDRIVPILAANLASGPVGRLESLSRLARKIQGPEIDRVLAYIFNRWIGHFKGRQTGEGLELSHEYWRAFRELTSHPRFKLIKNWPEELVPILYSPDLAWFRKQDIARVLEGDRRSYIHLENVLFKSQDWEHFNHEEIDLLDEACDRLFNETVETGCES